MKQRKLMEEVEMIGQGVSPLTPEQAAEISAYFQQKLAKSRQKKEASGKRLTSKKNAISGKKKPAV